MSLDELKKLFGGIETINELPPYDKDKEKIVFITTSVHLGALPPGAFDNMELRNE